MSAPAKHAPAKRPAAGAAHTTGTPARSIAGAVRRDPAAARRRGGGEPVSYRIVPVDPHAHLFEITLTIARPDPEGQRLALPAWIPGSYMIREFARHVVSIAARSGRRTVRLRKLDKHGWQASRCDGPLEIRYTVYAWDLSVRAAHLDASHGFFNGTSVFVAACGRESAACSVDILPPNGPRFHQPCTVPNAVA